MFIINQQTKDGASKPSKPQQAGHVDAHAEAKGNDAHGESIPISWTTPAKSWRKQNRNIGDNIVIYIDL